MFTRIGAKFLKLKMSDYFKSVVTLVTGTGISQIIPLLIAPIIARLYNPFDYAVLASYTSITILLTIGATGMYDAALMLDKTDREAVNTAAVAIVITILITGISALLMIFFRNDIAKWTGNENVSFWLYLVPITVFCSGFYQTLNIWNNRKQRYKRLASNKIIMTAITSSLTLGLGLLHFKEKGLLISLIAGKGFALLLLFLQTLRNDKLILEYISKIEIRRAFIQHQDFPKYNMPQGFLDGIKESSTIWIISNFYGSAVLGSYSFAKNILMRPLQVIGSSVSQVFYQKASSTYNKTGNIYSFTKKTFLILFSIGLPFALIIFFWGDNLFSLVFSTKWKEAGGLAQILIFYLLFSFVGSALSSIPLILNKQKQFLILVIFIILMQICILYVFGYLDYSINITLAVFSIISIFFYIIIFLWFNIITNTINSRFNVRNINNN